MSSDQEVELERQIGCVVNRIRILSGQKAKGGLTVHFDGSGLLGRTFTENFTVCRDLCSREKMGRQMEEGELESLLCPAQRRDRDGRKSQG